MHVYDILENVGSENKCIFQVKNIITYLKTNFSYSIIKHCFSETILVTLYVCYGENILLALD